MNINLQIVRLITGSWPTQLEIELIQHLNQLIKERVEKLTEID